MKVLNIITPCSRPENLVKLYQSMVLNLRQDMIIQWWIIIDRVVSLTFVEIGFDVFMANNPYFNVHFEMFYTHGKGTVGHDQRNYALKYLPFKDDEYVYFLDDDNILPNDFTKEIVPFMNGENIIVVDQYLKNGEIRLKAGIDFVYPGYIDTAQFILPYNLVKNRQFPLQYDGDGIFIHMLFQEYDNKFVFINKPLSYYNFLR